MNNGHLEEASGSSSVRNSKWVGEVCEATNALKMDGIDVKGYGVLDAGEDGLDFSDTFNEGKIHLRLVVKGGKLKGAVFVGPPGIGKDLAHVIQTDADLSTVIDRLKNGDWKALGEV